MDTLQMLWMMVKHLSHLVDWLIIAVLHLALGCFAVWWWQISPDDVQESVLLFAQSRSAAVVGLLGLSLSTALGAYLWVAQRLVRKLTTWVVWRPIHDAMQRERDG